MYVRIVIYGLWCVRACACARAYCVHVKTPSFPPSLLPSFPSSHLPSRKTRTGTGTGTATSSATATCHPNPTGAAYTRGATLTLSALCVRVHTTPSSILSFPFLSLFLIVTCLLSSVLFRQALQKLHRPCWQMVVRRWYRRETLLRRLCRPHYL